MLGFIKRYRELFAIGALLIVPLITYLAHAKRGRELNGLDRVVLRVTAPIERAVTGVVGGVIDRYGEWVALGEVREENFALRAENHRLEGQVASLSEAQAENLRLRRLLGFSEVAAAPMLVAPVIGDGPSLNLLTLKIGKGSNDGVAKGMAVVSSEGIVGRVLNAGPTSADVLLVSDSNFAVPVRVQRSRARAKVMGQGAREHPALVQAQRTDDIEDGDILVTSGTDGVFPKGLVVGRVSGVERPNHGMFLRAQVVPAVDVSGPNSTLEEVFVMMGIPGLRDFPEASLPAK